MLEALYRAHFTDGVDLGSREALARVADGIGLDAAGASSTPTPARPRCGPGWPRRASSA